MDEKIKKDWIFRFRKMMKENSLLYNQIVLIGGFKNGNVLKFMISRGLLNFVKLVVFIYEKR